MEMSCTASEDSADLRRQIRERVGVATPAGAVASKANRQRSSISSLIVLARRQHGAGDLRSNAVRRRAHRSIARKLQRLRAGNIRWEAGSMDNAPGSWHP